MAAGLLTAGSASAGEGAPPEPPPRPVLAGFVLPPDVPGLIGLPGPIPKGRDLYYPFAAAQAKLHGLPPEVADAVIRVESGYNPNVVGGVGERGLMQVLPTTATLLGFSGAVEGLADPETNIRLGVRYLAGAWKQAGGDLCRTLMKYRAGHKETRMSALSVEYCRRAKVHLLALGSPLGEGALPAVDFIPTPAAPKLVAGARPPAGAKLVPGTQSIVGPALVPLPPTRRVVRIAGRVQPVVPAKLLRGARFWDAHAQRIKAIEERLPWKRGGILAGG